MYMSHFPRFEPLSYYSSNDYAPNGIITTPTRTYVKNKPFVVVEGRDGVGKTTVVQALQNVYHGVALKTPVSPKETRKHYDHCTSLEARFLFYVSDLAIASRRIETVRKIQHVFADRFLHSTLAYHAEMGVDTSLVDFSKLSIAQPDATICLTGDRDILLERVRMRDGLLEAQNMKKNSDFLQRISDRIAGGATHVIDTTRLTLGEVIGEVVTIIDSL